MSVLNGQNQGVDLSTSATELLNELVDADDAMTVADAMTATAGANPTWGTGLWGAFQWS